MGSILNFCYCRILHPPTTELVRLVKGTARNSPIKAGDYFGHEVMIDHQKYLATVVSLQTTTGWKISRGKLGKAVDIDKLKKAPRKKG